MRGVSNSEAKFQNLRSTPQTELTEMFPEHVVCAWLGNAEKVAKGHYLQVTPAHFHKAAGVLAEKRGGADHNNRNDDGGSSDNNGGNGDVNGDGKSGAESGAAHAGLASQGPAWPLAGSARSARSGGRAIARKMRAKKIAGEGFFAVARCAPGGPGRSARFTHVRAIGDTVENRVLPRRLGA